MKTYEDDELSRPHFQALLEVLIDLFQMLRDEVLDF